MPATDRRSFLLATGGAALGALTLPGLLPAADPVPFTVLFFGGDLPEVRKDLDKDYALKALTGGVKPTPKGQEKPATEDNIVGLEQLGSADLWIGSANKRTFPSETQLGHFQKYLAAGKPFVGYRAASHVFQNWLVVDREVFGAKYGGHHLLNKEKDLKVELSKAGALHPIFKGIEPPQPLSGSYVYTEVAPDVTLLLTCGLPGDMMPHTWVRENTKTKGRVFYTRYDAKELATNETCRKMFLRGIAWAMGGDLAKYRKAS
jgi:type 1 glutamine amidotransferase